MIGCCNSLFTGSFSYVLFSSKDNYRRVEFGICPHCGCLKFKDYRVFFDGTDKVKYLTGKAALQKLEYWRKKISEDKHGTKGNQNVYYGDFQKTNRRDDNGNLIYLQLRKNFNDESEVIGEIKTKVYN